MSDNSNDDVASQVQSKINELEQRMKVVVELNIKAREIFENDQNYLNNPKYMIFDKTYSEFRLARSFYSEHTRIDAAKSSFNQKLIDEYYKNVLAELNIVSVYIKDLNIGFSQIIAARSVTQNVREGLERILSDMEDSFKFLIRECKQFNVPAPSNVPEQPTSTTTKKKTYGEFSVSDLDSLANFSLQQYLDIAKYTELDDALFKNLVKGIHDLSQGFYSPGINVKAPKILSYASIVGPSLMGKTQFAFALARLCPVFYTNFAEREDMQDVYTAFKDISVEIKSCLAKDVDLMKNKLNIGLNSGEILPDLKLGIIGLLWKLVEESTKFDGFDEGNTSNRNWFRYYLEKRTIEYERMTYCEYLENLSKNQNYMHIIIYFIEKLIENMSPKSFKIPIVFIDEINSNNQDGIKLLRNLCRLIGLECVLASTNAMINNLLNINKNGSSAPRPNHVWVHAIRILPKANLKAIFKLLGWDKYSSDCTDFKTTQLLTDLGIKYDRTNETQLHNLISFIIKDSETALQGVPLIVFKALQEILEDYGGDKYLDTKAVWVYILNSLRHAIKERKEAAFTKSQNGRYLSLAMMSSYQVIATNLKRKSLCELAPTSDIILRSVNQHFYFFGRPTDPSILPFGYKDDELYFRNLPYDTCSHFKLFRENALFCMALWIAVYLDSPVDKKREMDDTEEQNAAMIVENLDEEDDVSVVEKDEPSVASIVSRCIYKLHDSSGNPEALKNNSASQENMVHWALCYATMGNVSELNPGVQYMERFVNLIQLNEIATVTNNNFTSTPNTKVTGVRKRFKFDTCPELLNFLSEIKIPYLLPPHNFTDDIKNKLEGLCQFGTCSRLKDQQRLDIKFDLFYRNEEKFGYCECKYVDVNISKSIVLDYAIRTKNSPLSMFVTFSLQNRLKSAELWNSDIFTEEDDDENDIENVARKMANLDINAQANMEAEEKRRKLEANRKARLKAEKEKEAKIPGVSIYSLFHEDNQLKLVPLVVTNNPTGVFLIIQTNFFVPKK